MQALLIPIHLDALILSSTTSVRDGVAQFDRLPFFDGIRDVRGDVPNLSESIASDPFETPNLHLPPGVHLHWALPDGLIRGMHNEEGSRFETVPNRWLISRFSSQNKLEKQWVVESDYLHPENAKTNSVSVPYQPKTDSGEHAPFRFLGRQLSLKNWENVQDVEDHG